MARYRKGGKRAGKGARQSWRRVLMPGTLTALSPLHIGSGDTEMQAVMNHRGESEVQRFNALLRDARGMPYIPGSTLRGFLRSQVPDGAVRERLFGLARQAADADRIGQVGVLRVADAPLLDKTVHMERMIRNSIDPLTGTTLKHFLAAHEQVPPGTRFTVQLYLDALTEDITEEDVAVILAALRCLPELGIGSSRSIGLGLMRWEQKPITALSASSIRRWLQTEQKQSDRPASGSLSASQRLQAAFERIPTPKADTVTQAEHPLRSIGVTLEALSQVLVGGAADRNPDADTSAQSNDSGGQAPQIVACRRGSSFVIPGSTLKGWMRAHARRILLTLTQGANEAQVDEALGELFGSLLAGQSVVRCSETICKEIQPVDRYFNAVDRFSGGVKNTALFGAQVVPRGSRFEGDMKIDVHRLQDWMKLLLVFVFRDANEGDLVLGWGKARGLGEMRMTITCRTQLWLQSEDYESMTRWEQALLARIGVVQEDGGQRARQVQE